MSTHKDRVIFCEESLMICSSNLWYHLSYVHPLKTLRHDNLSAFRSVAIVCEPRHVHKYLNFANKTNGAKAGVVITGRIALNETVPQSQPPGCVFIPWCKDDVFQNWVELLTAYRLDNVHAQWLLLHRPEVNGCRYLNNLEQQLSVLPSVESCFLTRDYFAEQIGVSRKKLCELFQSYFHVAPGAFLRAFELFRATSDLMYQESQLQYEGRRGRSPLAARDDDYRRRLKRLLGITYSELRALAANEHWVAVWMRKWRERVNGTR